MEKNNQSLATLETYEPSWFSKLIHAMHDYISTAYRFIHDVLIPPSEATQIDRIARKLNKRFSAISDSIEFSRCIDVDGKHTLQLSVDIPGASKSVNEATARELLPLVSPLNIIHGNTITHKAHHILGLANIGISGEDDIGITDIMGIIALARPSAKSSTSEEPSQYILALGEHELVEVQRATETKVSSRPSGIQLE